MWARISLLTMLAARTRHGASESLCQKNVFDSKFDLQYSRRKREIRLCLFYVLAMLVNEIEALHEHENSR